MMKLINFRALNVHLDRFHLCNYQNTVSSIILNKFRYISTEKHPSKSAPYQYDVNQLHNSLDASIKTHSPNEINANNSQHLFNINEIDVQSIVNYVILAAKCGISWSVEDEARNSFLNRVSCNIEEMSAANAVSALIALNFLNVPVNHPVNCELTVKITHMLKDLKEFPLIPLTNLAIYAHENQDKTYPSYLCAHADSHVLEHLHKCEDFQSFYYVTLCFKCLPTLTTKSGLSLHKDKMKTFLADQSFDVKANLSGLFEVLNLYGLYKGMKHSRIMRNILLMMVSEIPNFSNAELLNYAMIRDIINEPASLIEKIVETAESRPTKSTDLDLIYCRLYKKTPENLENISKDLLAIIDSIDSKDIIKNRKLFSILQKKRDNSMKDIYQKYWNKVAEDLIRLSNQGLVTDSILANLCYRYCLIQNGTHHRFRSKKFESLLRDLVLIEIRHGTVQTTLPTLSRFIIAYANDSLRDRITLPEFVVKKLEEIAPQLSVNDIMDISTAISYFHQNDISPNIGRKTRADIIHRINRLENVVDKQIERIIDEGKKLKIDATCYLIKAYAHQKGFKQTHILEKLTQKLEDICSSDDVILTSRTISNITSGLSRIVFIVPKLCERMLQFVNENMDVIDGETVSYLLYYLFSMGYEPNNEFSRTLLNSGGSEERKTKLLDVELFDFKNFIRIIERDFEYMPAWLIVQACLALSFYRVLPLDMIRRVFNIDFLTRIEKDLSLTSQTTNYSKNVLNLLMQLNRSICLNNPEARLPWFQQNFIEAQLAADPPKNNSYRNEVYEMLLSCIGGDKSMIRMNHNTPYGYRIPFVIYFNSHRQLVSPPLDEGPQTLNKVAIIPLPKKPLHFNGKRGYDLLEERHLNILGYVVIQICFREWNSIHMKLPGARENYLKNILNKNKLLIE